ncbi:Por secretion system C-terminal sorting domain-containing protein [Dyadobacter sp. SG02]|uniref:T9SS type A sorting domain-containing protein n=1 Tax=Dyadobacter sp. SG02 TaxID=1855291 RepID=UPI0008AF2EF5|nr:T9SS type A sorting domain-containing protein [Dyadobacter sp. SG02]SEI38767.1 Por secretion system C-terminal sorting domain-containing protein [Dyadobacter sp. SG02]
MTHFKKCDTGKLCLFLASVLLSFQTTFAQDYQALRQNALDKLDLSGLGNKLFMNAAVTTRNEIDYLKQISSGKLSKPESVSAEEWHNLYERIADADLRAKNAHMPYLKDLVETNLSKLTRNDTIPLGIIDMEAVYLSEKQLRSNEDGKRTGKPVDFATYTPFRILYAAALRQDVYQAEVWFKISPKLLITNHAQPLIAMAIDFGDGKGFTNYSFQEQLIKHRFETEGKHPVKIRLIAENRHDDFETYVDVRQLERIPPAMEFHVSAPAAVSDTFLHNARTQVVGATIRIVTGCDGILDKTVIIGEGFDFANDVNLDELEAMFRERFSQWLREGFDLVFIDYDDGTAAIENNAQVMKAIIQQINTIKQGNVDNIVLGVCMSGLVARYALRKMEVDGIAHHVRLMICYDTPNQGANVPVGLTQLLWESSPTLLTQVILKFFAKTWRDYYYSMTTPAATQMMLHWGGQLTGGVGSKSPAFDAFQTSLNSLGNGGYPQNCRNIAITHGSMNAQHRELFGLYNYGDRILRSWTPFGLQNSNIDVHTNALNQISNVLRFATWGIFSKRLGVSLNYNSPFNDDFLPGGLTPRVVPNKLFSKTKDFTFCFIPTFSAIDYQGPLNTQVQRELLDLHAVNAVTGPGRQTPFANIYGTDNDTEHIRAGFIPWTTIGQSENLLAGGTTCPLLPHPPQPIISVYNVCYPFKQSRVTEGNTANISVSLATPSGGQYIHNWLVLPTQQAFTTTGDQITFQAEHPGQYQVICTRTYPNRRDLESTHEVTFTVTNCGDPLDLPQNPQVPPQIDPDISIFDIWEDDFLLTTPQPDSVAVFAHYEGTLPAILYASKADETFVPASELEAAGMFPEFAQLFAEEDPRDALPVVLTAFTAAREHNSTLLAWTTASEINSDHFEIEWSPDAKTWQKIGEVACNNTGSAMTNYSFIDLESCYGMAYYRLKMLDVDKSFAYSRICSVQSAKAGLLAFPNPIEADLPFSLLTGGKKPAKITFFDLAGKTVLESVNVPERAQLRKLLPGHYLLRVLFTDGTTANQLVIKRN